MLRPLNKYIVAKLVEKEKKGTLLLLADEEKDKFEVLAVGEEIKDICVGDKILTDGFGRKEYEIDGERLYIIHYDRVIGVMT